MRNTSIWDIEVDHSNEDDLKELLQRIKSQLGSIRVDSLESVRKIKFSACSEIFETDISHLYTSLSLDERPIYYVYAHCGDNNIAIGKDGITTWAATFGIEKIPFYIGKGTGNRAYELNRNETHRKFRQKLQRFGSDIKVKILKEGLTELEALCYESKLIDIFGVIGKGGRLVNLDEGTKSVERQKLYAEHLKKLNKYYDGSLSRNSV